LKSSFEKVYHEIEKTHFWFRSRRDYILDFVTGVDKKAKILDIGCSSGILLNEIRDTGIDSKLLYGIDISGNAIKNCRQNGLENTFVMDAQQIELNEKFDCIISSDCLEHLEDDSKALRNWYDLLNDEGSLTIFVPAYMLLWSEHDVANMHYRRYTLKELVSRLEEAGFIIEKSSYWNFFLFVPVLSVRLLSRFVPNKGRQQTGDLKQGSFMNPILYSLIKMENKLLKKINFPFGISAFCLARKA